MKKHIICFGDSNTHGLCADVSDCAEVALCRFNESERWTCLLQRELGAEYLVVEEGLSGRTTVFEDPLHEGMAGIGYIEPCLKSHEPVALLIIMLGTNDTKDRFAASAKCIALGMERLIRKAQGVDCWGPDGKPNILVVCPPPIGAEVIHSEAGGTMGTGCAQKSVELPPLMRETAERLGCHYLDAAPCPFNRVDYMHLTREGHAMLARMLAKAIPTLS